MTARYEIPNCDVADLAPGDLIAWKGRAVRVVALYPVEPVDYRADEVPGQIRNPLSGHMREELPPIRIHLDDGTRRGVHLRMGFRPVRSRNVERLKPHHAVCTDCGYLWPCPDERIDREVAAAAQTLERACNHCGKTEGSMQMYGGPHLDIPGQMGAWFHSRTKRRAKCADSADAYRARWLIRSAELRAAEQDAETTP